MVKKQSGFDLLYSNDVAANTAHKLLVSILLGWIGFAAVFFSPTFKIPPHSISILWSNIFPLIAAIAYGPIYGIVAAIAGLEAFYPFMKWPSNGWGNLFGTCWTIFFYIWNGYCARNPRWRDNLFVANIPAFIFYAVLIYFAYPLLFSLNPPPWMPTAATHIDRHVVLGIIVKTTINMYGSLLVAVIILRMNSVRRLLHIPASRYYRFGGRIFTATVAFSVMAWLLWGLLRFLLITPVPHAEELNRHHNIIALACSPILSPSLMRG